MAQSKKKSPQTHNRPCIGLSPASQGREIFMLSMAISCTSCNIFFILNFSSVLVIFCKEKMV